MIVNVERGKWYQWASVMLVFKGGHFLHCYYDIAKGWKRGVTGSWSLTHLTITIPCFGFFIWKKR